MSLSYQNQSNMIQTPKFNSFDTPKLSKGLIFGHDISSKEEKKSSGIRISPANEKQWEETIKILIPSFSKILKKFCSLPCEK